MSGNVIDVCPVGADQQGIPVSRRALKIARGRRYYHDALGQQPVPPARHCGKRCAACHLRDNEAVNEMLVVGPRPLFASRLGHATDRATVPLSANGELVGRRRGRSHWDEASPTAAKDPAAATWQHQPLGAAGHVERRGLLLAEAGALGSDSIDHRPGRPTDGRLPRSAMPVAESSSETPSSGRQQPPPRSQPLLASASQGVEAQPRVYINPLDFDFQIELAFAVASSASCRRLTGDTRAPQPASDVGGARTGR